MEWREVFWITFTVIIIANLGYIFMGSGEVQPWNDTMMATEEESIKWAANKGIAIILKFKSHLNPPSLCS